MGFVVGLELQRWPGGGLPPLWVFNPCGGQRLSGSAHRLPVGSFRLGALEKLHMLVSEEQKRCRALGHRHRSFPTSEAV